ncbi:hypothetical protein BASA81_000676 [Batrachochytrium salamandrivorans]|nr:hypothetical protein BASA81_000676 [Batrachochytrium salamandrivorans]
MRWLLFALGAVLVCGLEFDEDLARRFGVAESTIAKRPSKFTPECDFDDNEDDFFNQFHPYDEVVKFMRKLAASYPNRAKLVEIGRSGAGHLPIYAMEVKGKTEGVVLALAGIHGREWTSIAATLFALKELVSSSPSSAVHVVPIANPDGYVTTFSSGSHSKEKFAKGELVKEASIPNRYYRKNGRGVDLNRNFPGHWGNDTKTKSLRLPGSDVYQGPFPSSEPEIQALEHYANRVIDRLVGVIDFHCCMGAVLAPVLTGQSALVGERNHLAGLSIVKALSRAGKGVTKTVKNGDGLPGQYEWRPRESKDRGAGLSSTWAFHTLAVDLAYVVELRGKFVAPCFEIKQLGKEAWFGLESLLNEANKQPILTLAQRQLEEEK